MNNFGRTLEIGPTDNASDERTPRQPLHLIPDEIRETFVPYYNVMQVLVAGEDDMTRITPGSPRASGEAIEVSGSVLNEKNRPISNAVIEIWNANTHGRYTHIEDTNDLPLDPNFIGLGRVKTDANGNYRFWTISPGSYLARPDINRWRPKHIHMSILGSGSRLITQMYFPNAEHNETDPMRILMGDSFHLNVGKEYSVKTNDIKLGYKFDIVIGGRNSTYFED